MPDLLIELFSEEIPARMQGKAADDLKTRVTNGLVEAGLTYAGAAAFATPRRLALRVDGLTERSPDVKEERKGPRVDAPDKAIEGFLRGAGLTRDDLIERDEKKGRVFFAVIEKPGRPAAEIVERCLRMRSATSHGRNRCAGAQAACAGYVRCTGSSACCRVRMGRKLCR